jgi:hypothetical protein
MPGEKTLMTKARRPWLAAVLFALALCGCRDGSPVGGGGKDREAAVQDNLAKLGPEDSKLAAAQKYCAVENDNRLGEMGKPVKILVRGEPVFLCCGGCKKAALKDPDRTLARVKELKDQAAREAKEK